MTNKPPCPRCKGPIPKAGREGDYPGAISRVDNSTEVCSACGTDEAIGRGPVPMSQWPIEHRNPIEELEDA